MDGHAYKGGRHRLDNLITYDVEGNKSFRQARGYCTVCGLKKAAHFPAQFQQSFADSR